MKLALVILAACLAVAGQAQDIDRYAYFGEYGVLDPGVSNRTAHDLVRDGIRSENPKIVESTIGALNQYASKLFPDIDAPPDFIAKSPYGVVPDRDFDEVLGLKEFLIGYWRERNRLSGGATHYETFMDALLEPDSPELQRLLERMHRTESPELPDAQPASEGKPTSFGDRFNALLPDPPEWLSIPNILVSLYPNDADVLRFIWERDELAFGKRDVSTDLEGSLSTLVLLNAGKFDTSKANALRINVLTAPMDDGLRYAAAAMAAVRGLGLSMPPEAIPALLAIGAEQALPGAMVRSDVLVTLAGYDDEALAPYAADIAHLLSRSAAIVAVSEPLGAVPEAVERLDALVRRHSAAAGRPVPPESSPRAPDIGLYKYFRDRGIFDPGVSSARANALVRGGMHSDDARIVDAAIRALGWFIAHQLHGFPLPYGVLPERNFAKIPGLKEWLMEHWRRQRERHGYDSLAGFVQASGGVSVPGNAGTASYEEMNESNSRTPAWLGIPQILCALYPGDAAVLRLVWERHAGDATPAGKLATLSLLNIGTFATPQADALRLDALAVPERSAAASRAARAAARGLALSRPAEAIPHLLSAGLRHDQGEGEVLVALAGYDAGSLLPHVEELSQLLAKSSAPHPLGAVPEAIERLEAVVRLAAE